MRSTRPTIGRALCTLGLPAQRGFAGPASAGAAVT